MDVRNDLDAARWLKIYGYLPVVECGDLRLWPGEVGGRMLSNAVLAAQRMYASHDLKCDGICGPKTKQAMSAPRCAWPDAVDDELADMHGESIWSYESAANVLGVGFGPLKGICRLHHTMRAQRNNRWRWPLECSQNLTVDYDTSTAASSLDTEWIWSEVRAAHATLGIGCNRGEGRAHISISWRRFWGNTIGEAQFPPNDCGANVYCHLSRSYAPNDVQVGNLILHEMGHNFGESHHSSGIMAPTMSNNHTRIYWPADDTAAIALREYYWQGDPEPPVEPPEPPTEPEKPILPEGVGLINIGGVMYSLRAEERE